MSEPNDRAARELEAARARTLALLDPISDAGLVEPHSTLMSPLVWDLAHIGHYEELWLLRELGAGEPTDPRFDDIYDAFRHPRSVRPTLDILGPAEARDFVADMPDGLAAPIAQGGTNVSGGQRQRLAIARALVRKPEIFLFDDSFSALDLGTDARLRAALRPVTRDAAVIIVAQRISTIADADTIVVLDAGAVVGFGTHDELLETCPTYVEIVESQLSVEDAA